MRLAPFDETLYRELQDRDFAISYLEAAFEDSLEEFLVALRKFIQANGGFSQCAELTGLSREAIYRMLSESGNPELRSIQSILSAYDLRFGIHSQSAEDGDRELALSR